LGEHHLSYMDSENDGQVAVVMVSQSKALENFVAEELAAAGLDTLSFCRKEFPPEHVTLLILGDRPCATMTGDAKVTSLTHRGLWVRTVTGHRGYVMRELEELEQIDLEDGELRAAWLKEWRGDLTRMAARVLKKDAPRDISVQIYHSAKAATPLLRRLSVHTKPWAFDIESFDGKDFPSRKDVSTDPCHEDYRVRGVALAWNGESGAWIELQNDDPDEARPLLDLAFTTPTEKWAFNGSFDEEGLTYNRWVSEVRNRAGDAMLDMVALSDGRHAALRLERAVVDYLGFDQYWGGFDKARIKELSVEDVGRAAIEDACATWILRRSLAERLRRGEYFEWPTWVQKDFTVQR